MEVKEIARQCQMAAKCGFDISLEERKKIVALTINQKLYNEQLNDVDSDIRTHKFLSIFRRMSIPIVYQVFRYIKSPQIIEFDPVENPSEIVSDHLMKSMLIDPSILPTSRCPGCPNDIDVETEVITLTAQELACEIDMFVLGQIRNYVGTICYIDPLDPHTDFVSSYCTILENIKSNKGIAPNWVVATTEVKDYLTEIATSYTPAQNETFAFGIKDWGIVSWRWNDKLYTQRLYENMFSSEHEAIVGYYGAGVENVKLRPKVLLEIIPDDNGLEKIYRGRLRSQFDIVLPEASKDMYVRINLKVPD